MIKLWVILIAAGFAFAACGARGSEVLYVTEAEAACEEIDRKDESTGENFILVLENARRGNGALIAESRSVMHEVLMPGNPAVGHYLADLERQLRNRQP